MKVIQSFKNMFVLITKILGGIFLAIKEEDYYKGSNNDIFSNSYSGFVLE